MDLISSGFGTRLKKLRLALQLGQMSFANSLGISQGYLSDLESDKKMPSRALLIAISNRYHVNDEWLVLGDGEKMFVRELNFGEKVRALRRGRLRKLTAKGIEEISQSDLAEGLNVSEKEIQDWESNRSNPKPHIIGALASYAGISSSYFDGSLPTGGFFHSSSGIDLKEYEALADANVSSEKFGFRINLIPIYGSVTDDLFEDPRENGPESYLPVMLQSPSDKGYPFALRVKSDNFKPLASYGENIIILPGKLGGTGQYVLLNVKDTNKFCIRLQRYSEKDDMVSYKPFNKKQKTTFSFEYDHVPGYLIVGVVAGIFREPFPF